MTISPECQAAFDAGYNDFAGRAHFLRSQYFSDASEMGMLLGRFWVDGHVKAIMEKREKEK